MDKTYVNYANKNSVLGDGTIANPFKTIREVDEANRIFIIKGGVVNG